MWSYSINFLYPDFYHLVIDYSCPDHLKLKGVLWLSVTDTRVKLKGRPLVHTVSLLSHLCPDFQSGHDVNRVDAMCISALLQS